MGSNEMSGRIALVTGAAGGIGDAVVRELTGLGVTVAAVDHDAEALHTSAKLLNEGGRPVHAFPCDVSSAAEVDAVVDRVERELGPIDYLVNAAGILRLAPALSLSDDDWASTFAVNAQGVFFVSRAVASRMTERRRGSLVSVASNSAATPRTGMAAYAASKAAVEMFTKCLGLELAAFGIRCNVVAPGSTETQMLRKLWKDGDGAESSITGTASEFRVGIPLGKIAQPFDVAQAVAFLLSDRASHITLHSLTVDGGAGLGV